ncbi:MAG: hypothetical protein SPI09_02905 [Candidatus Limivicinus sp.]|nr:hypothetical protein [Clostridiales bacterium]MDY6132297.1 hypothetical protein [Candidatus Limivicinus sp.]
MEYTKEELIEAKRQIDSTLHKLREVIKTFESKENPARYKSQITLAKRRVQAFEIANYFIIKQIESDNSRLPVAYSCLNSAPAAYALS